MIARPDPTLMQEHLFAGLVVTFAPAILTLRFNEQGNVKLDVFPPELFTKYGNKKL